MGLEAVTTVSQSYLDNVVNIFIPSILGIFVIMGLVVKVILPSICDLLSARDKKRSKKASLKADGEQKRILLMSLLGLRDEFDDWLADAVLTLQIECAAHPGEPSRVELLDALIASKDNNAAKLTKLHVRDLEALPTASELDDVRRDWDDLRRGINRLPATEATGIA